MIGIRYGIAIISNPELIIENTQSMGQDQCLLALSQEYLRDILNPCMLLPACSKSEDPLFLL